MKKFLKRFGTDIAGYFCLLLVIPIGWLPGPGGIPLLIAALSLLSVHNPWAKSLLDYVKKHSDSLRTIVFPRNKRIELMWDIFAGLLFSSAFIISVFADTTVIRICATAMGAIASTAFMFNRHRLEALQKTLRRNK